MNRSIEFFDWELKALFDGRKTRFTRPLKKQPPSGFGEPECGGGEFWTLLRVREFNQWFDIRCPFGSAGDKLIVKEPLLVNRHHNEVVHITHELFDEYRKDKNLWKYCAARSMPKWIIPKTIVVTSINIFKVHKLTDAQVVAEGVEEIHIEKNRRFFDVRDIHGLAFCEKWHAAFGKKYHWRSNPWAWSVEFKIVEDGRP